MVAPGTVVWLYWVTGLLKAYRKRRECHSMLRERRSGSDRRQEDVGPPGKIEQRRRVEARKPEIAEIVLSEAEWEANFGRRPTAAGEAGLTIAQVQEAAAIFDRIRD